MTVANSIDNLVISPTSTVNGALTTYSISFEIINIVLEAGDIFYITFPSEIGLKGSACTPLTTSNLVTCICT